MTYIIKSSVMDAPVFYAGEEAERVWPAERSAAAIYPDEAAAKAALAAIPFVSAHYVRRAQVVPA